MHFGFEAGAAGGAVGVGLVFVQFGHRQQRFQQRVDAFARHALVLTTSVSPPHSLGSKPAVPNC